MARDARGLYVVRVRDVCAGYCRGCVGAGLTWVQHLRCGEGKERCVTCCRLARQGREILGSAPVRGGEEKEAGGRIGRRSSGIAIMNSVGCDR